MLARPVESGREQNSFAQKTGDYCEIQLALYIVFDGPAVSFAQRAPPEWSLLAPKVLPVWRGLNLPACACRASKRAFRHGLAAKTNRLVWEAWPWAHTGHRVPAPLIHIARVIIPVANSADRSKIPASPFALIGEARIASWAHCVRTTSSFRVLFCLTEAAAAEAKARV